MEWIRESNLIENVDDVAEDKRGAKTFQLLQRKEMSLGTIRWIHKSLMVELRPDIAGQWRRCNVSVGGYVAPAWPSVPHRMAEWLAQWDGMRVAEDIQCAHVAFENVHPFEDGNGRTGRMIMNWQRAMAGLEPLCIKASERGEYYKWFTNERPPHD